MISVVILTLNEELNLPACLESVRFSDDIVVFDSFSTDATERIARAAGARFMQRRFDGYASQRNAALAADFRHPWVLMLDADEALSPALREEIMAVVRSPQAADLYRVRRKDMFMGRWLRHSSGYPTWFPRLFRRGRVRVEREINEEYLCDGPAGFLHEHLVHHPFGKGIDYWFERHNRYSRMEAAQWLEETRQALPWRDVLSRDPSARRRFLKRLSYRMPCRPILVFLYLYAVRRGFLDGRAGLTFSILRAFYEYMIDVKVNEMRLRGAGKRL